MDVDAVADTGTMDVVAEVDATILDKEITTNKQQHYHQQNQPRGRGTFPLPHTTIKEEDMLAATSPIRTKCTAIGCTATPADMMLIMRAQDASTRGLTIKWDAPGRIWMRTKVQGIVHRVQESIRQSCLETMRGTDKVGQ